MGGVILVQFFLSFLTVVQQGMLWFQSVLWLFLLALLISIGLLVKKNSSLLLKRSTVDAITKLPNRYGLEKEITNLYFTENNKVAFLIIHVKRIQYVNIHLGFTIGDEMLYSVGDRLKKQIGEIGYLSRLSGDRFALLVTSSDVQDISSTLEMIQSSLKQPFSIRGQLFYLSCSVGYTISTLEEREKSLQRAELALLYAEKIGRASSMYEPSMKKEITDQIELTLELQRAVTNQEFVLYYQPQINTRTQKLSGMEALVRWNHPEKGIISPATFIPTAEETGLIIPLGKWVLYEACRQCAEWKEEGYSIGRLGVNVSLVQFVQDDFIDIVKDALKQTGLSPKDLELELTESISMEQDAKAIEKLKNLHQLGVHVSIDDFGTGYSNLQYLQQYQVHTIKIAPQFVTELALSYRNKWIISAITFLAEQCNVKLIAEGVETVEQLDFLNSLNCTHVQGYYFSPPLPSKEFVSFVGAM